MDLIQKIKAAGVLGAGGAGFPTHVKLASASEWILLNGAECEPLLRVDQQLMEQFADEILLGLHMAGKQVSARGAIVGVKGKHKGVIAAMQERINALDLSGYIEIMPLQDRYPAGDEQVLVHELTGRVVPEASIPLSAGCVVINSETALNIYHADKGIPVTHTWLTVAGDIPAPVTLRVPVGTPVREVLRLGGVEDISGYGMIDGGPMMGAVSQEFDGYVTKKSKGFILLKKYHHLLRKKSVSQEQARRIGRGACEQCRMCTDLCPRYLLGHNLQPHKVMRALSYGITDPEQVAMSQLCCECNACELFSCPAGLHPRLANSGFKKLLGEKGVRYKPEEGKAYAARQSREYRLIPTKRLIARLGLAAFDHPAPLLDIELRPEYVQISTGQHIGARAIPTVSPGEHVSAGQCIGQPPENSLGSAVHASISGTVTEAGEHYIRIKADAYV